MFLSPDRSLSERAAHRDLVKELKKRIADDPQRHHHIRNATVFNVGKVRESRLIVLYSDICTVTGMFVLLNVKRSVFIIMISVQAILSLLCRQLLKYSDWFKDGDSEFG